MDIRSRLNELFPLEHWKRAVKDNAWTLSKWLLFSVLIGVVVGAVGALFHHAIDRVTELRQAHQWLVLLLPVAGLAIVGSYHVTGMSDDRGTEFVISSVRDAKPLRIRTAPLIFLGTVLTHLCGGSSGREGAALQLGGCISSSIGRWMKLDAKDERVITMAGMAAGFSALFGTPLAAAVFAMELVSVGVMYYAAIVPCMLSALIAQMVAGFLGVSPTGFTLLAVPETTPLNLVRLLVLGILCSLMSILFCAAMHLGPRLYGKITQNPYLKALIGGCIVAALALLLGTDYQGAGMDVITQAVSGTARPEAAFLKILLTVLTLSAGYKGGEIVPALFTGATFGCLAGGLLGLPASFGAAAGMVAVFCGVTNCPLTSILLSYELFGGQGVALFALAIAVSYMLSGYWSLYAAQKIVYSKTRVEFVDRKTH
ncbi:MAG: chloride channel protein [Oscillospiraceae bacterium]|nr:chloride channel protein [Oscillospiraceae bacterium]